MTAISEAAIWERLREVPDPEIPTISVVDLGIIRSVEVGETIRVALLPTFSGCPAIDVMRREIAAKLADLGEVEVKIVYDEAWTTQRITLHGRRMLKKAQLVPPPLGEAGSDADREPVACPYCGSPETQLENLFGPTPCRSIYYCRHCRQPFERFKPV